MTCFALAEPGNLLSGSADRTIRVIVSFTLVHGAGLWKKMVIMDLGLPPLQVWQMVQRKLECLGTIDMKRPVQKLESYGEMIFAITQSRGLKVPEPMQQPMRS